MPPTKSDLDFYRYERELVGSVYYEPLTPEETIRLIELFSDHYGLEVPKVTFKGRNRHICYWYKPHLSFIESSISLGVVVHEFAHYIERRNPKRRGHTPELSDRILELWRHYNTLRDKNTISRIH